MSGTMTSFFSKNEDEDEEENKFMTEDDIDEDI